MTLETYHSIRNTLAEIIKGTIWEKHVFLVGGCVRDELMHREIHDVDIAIDMVNGGIRFARWLEKKHFTAKGRSLQIFMHFGTAKVQLRQFPDEVIDCVQTRKDRYVYEEHPRPEYNFGTIEEDAIRRDLTINSLYINISTGNLSDPTGLGKQDILHHVIRTPNNPDITFTDNPMHILRCIKFAVRYGWNLEKPLMDSMVQHVDILGEAMPKRLTKEVASILELEQKEVALNILETIGASQYITPAINLIHEMKEKGISPEKPLKKKRHHQYRKKKKAHKRPVEE